MPSFFWCGRLGRTSSIAVDSCGRDARTTNASIESTDEGGTFPVPTAGAFETIASPTIDPVLSVESFRAALGDFQPHLLPEVEKENRRYSVISLAVGVLVAAVIVMSKG